MQGSIKGLLEREGYIQGHNKGVRETGLFTGVLREVKVTGILTRSY